MRIRLRVAACALSVLALTVAGCASAPTAPTTVTKQAPAAVRTVTVAPTSKSTASVEDTTAVEDPATEDTTPIEDPATEDTTSDDTPAEQPPAASDSSWTMPDLVGQVLQDAQDKMQALTGDPAFFSDSTDATGAGRMQVLDSNWQVCAQTPAAGTKINASTSVSFAAVKLSESCP